MRKKSEMKPIELLHWESEYSVGVTEIDAQHFELMDQINKLISYSAENLAEGKKVFRETLEAVIEMSAVHFKTEENMLSKTDYDVFDDHKKEHDELMAKTESMKDELKKIQSVTGLYNLTVSFREWFLSHILLYDKVATVSFQAVGNKKNREK